MTVGPEPRTANPRAAQTSTVASSAPRNEANSAPVTDRPASVAISKYPPALFAETNLGKLFCLRT